MKIKNELDALGGRFKSVFKGLDTGNTMKSLTNEFNLSNLAAKQLLTTVGQFAHAMGQSKEYVGQFSSSLSKSAADYAAYMGASSAEEINAVGKKFAKATLGEVGELKDLRN